MVKKRLVTGPGYEGGLGGRAWSPALRVGPWLFVSGITPVDYTTGRNIGRGEPPTPQTPGDVHPEAQWRQVLSNIDAIVRSEGGTMDDVIMANVFVTDMSFYYEYEWVRREYFEEPFPVCTAVEVGSLVHPDWILEIEVTAYVEPA